MRVAITGASGLIGSVLGASLRADRHEVVRLVRRAPASPDEIAWDPATGRLDPAALEGLDAVVHLAGENVAGGRWTEARRARIRDSRLQGTRLLAGALARCARRPAVLVSASAIGMYGDRGEERLSEDAAPGEGFLPEVCKAWEAAADAARDAGLRVAHPRIGLVLSPDGGALARMLLPFRLGLGGRLGDGTHWVSWISLHDQVRVLRHLIDSQDLRGPVNSVAPHPVRFGEFAHTLGRVLHRPTVAPLPAFAARLLFGRMADELLLASIRVAPDRLLASGFRYRHPDLEGALRAVLSQAA